MQNNFQHSTVESAFATVLSWAGVQEEDVIGVLRSTDIAQLLPLGDRILIEVQLACCCNASAA